MTTAQRFQLPLTQWLDQNGAPLTGGLLYFYVTGTSTPLATYSDSGLTTPNANPVEAGDTPGAFSNGVWPDIFLQNAAYKVVLKDRNGVTVWTADPVYPFIDTDPTLDSFYDIWWYTNTKTTNGETCFIYNVPRALSLPIGLTDSIFTVDSSALPTGTTTFTLYKGGASIGTIAFATDGTVTVTFSSAVSFSVGQQFKMVGPVTADATANFMAFTFVFTVT